MAGDGRPQLRVVGGNDAVVRCERLSRETRWPPLRVVERAGAAAEVAAAHPVSPVTVPASRSRSVPKRAAWSQALLAGLFVVMLSSVGQAIAHW
jgi:hypothetical protein